MSFQRADVNADGVLDLTDPIQVLGRLFLGAGEAIPCEDAADSNDDGTIDLADAVYTLTYLFLSGAAPPQPFLECGSDTTADALDCEDFDPCHETPFEQAWVARYNGPWSSRDESRAIAVDSAGFVYVTGFSEGDKERMATIKYDPAGKEVWVARHPGLGGGSWGHAIVVDDLGNVLVCGNAWATNHYEILATKYSPDGVELWTSSQEGGRFAGLTQLALGPEGSVYVSAMSAFDFVTIRYAPDGSKLWFVYYDGPPHSEDFPFGLAVGPDGAVHVTGNSVGETSGVDFATVKYRRDGNEQWVARFDGEAHSSDAPRAIAVDAAGNVFVAGSSERGARPPRYDFTVVKYGPDGRELWVETFARSEAMSDMATSLAVDGNGNVIAAGNSYVSPESTFLLTLKLSGDGNRLWTAVFGGQGGENTATAVRVDSLGNAYVAGHGFAAGTGMDYNLIKYAPDGTEVWAARKSGPGEARDEVAAMALDAAGNAYLTGFSTEPHIVEEDGREFLTIQYDADGRESWSALYRGPGNGEDYATAVAIDPEGNVVVTGGSYASSTHEDYATVKYDASGKQLWVARHAWPGVAEERAEDLAIDSRGNVYVTGRGPTLKYAPDGTEVWSAFKSLASGKTIVVDSKGFVVVGGCMYVDFHCDYRTTKYNPIGVEVWTATYEGSGRREDDLSALALAQDGSIYVTGSSSDGVSGMDFVTIKYDPAGSALWTESFDGGVQGNDYAADLALGPSGEAVVVGHSERTPENHDLEFVTLKYSPEGELNWARVYRPTGALLSAGRRAAIDGVGNVYVTGHAYVLDDGGSIATLKYTPDGDMQWAAHYHGETRATEEPTAIAIDREGSVCVAGYSADGPGYDYVVIRYDAAGNQQWAGRFSARDNLSDIARGMALDSIGNIYVTGSSEGVETKGDFATVKYVPE